MPPRLAQKWLVKLLIITVAGLANASDESPATFLSLNAMKNSGVVKQASDNSCGAASIATLLSSFYGVKITEDDFLHAMAKTDGKASFEDMQLALPKFGFKGIGYLTTYDQLVKLQLPVIVHLKNEDNEHFSVLRGISESGVRLADPSLGNRFISKSQFLPIWQTSRRKEKGDMALGRFMAILPLDGRKPLNPEFFSKQTSMGNRSVIDTITLSPRL